MHKSVSKERHRGSRRQEVLFIFEKGLAGARGGGREFFYRGNAGRGDGHAGRFGEMGKSGNGGRAGRIFEIRFLENSLTRSL